MDSTRLQSSWSHKDHTVGERDKPHSYRHEPSAPRETTPSSSWRRWRCRWGRWRPRRQRSTGVSPSNLQLQISVSVFLCFRRPPLRKVSGDYFIVIFRSRRSFWKKDRWQRSHEGPNEWSHAAKESGRVGHPLSAFGPPLFRLLRSYAFFLPKKWSS